MNEIVRFDFEGRSLEFQKIDGEWWANGEEAADLLGYADKHQVLRLFKRHASEFLAAETGVVDLTTPGGVQPTRVFSPRGLEHLAILGRTETCVRFRRWILDVAEKLRNGARLVTGDQVARMLDRIRVEYDARLDAAFAVIEHQGATIKALSGAITTQASSAGKLLSYIAHSPEARAALAEARDGAAGQQRLPFASRLPADAACDNGNGDGDESEA